MTALSLSGLALLVALTSAWRAFRLSPPQETPHVPPYDDGELRELLELVAQELEAVRADYAMWKGDINTAVAEGIKHVERAENRIRATVRRAREELEEGGVRSPGLEAEARELSLFDGARGGESSVPTVPPNVASSGNRFAAFPGTWNGF